MSKKGNKILHQDAKVKIKNNIFLGFSRRLAFWRKKMFWVDRQQIVDILRLSA